MQTTASLGNLFCQSLFLQSLLNALKSLDLSHNKIQNCAEFLKVPLCLMFKLNSNIFSFFFPFP